MAEVTRFPDTLDLLRAHLQDTLGVPAGVRLPQDWPRDGFLHLTRTGGPRDRLTEDVQVDVAAWHPTSGAAAERIAGDAVSEVVALAGGRLGGWQVLDTGNPGGVAAAPDPRWPGMYRATALVRLRIRGVGR